MKIKKGFTLVEAIIAMGIMAVLLGFSTYALVQVKATIELQNGFSDVFSALQTAQNRARNSVTKPGGGLTVPDYISIAFRNTTYAFQTCTKSSSRAICTDDTASAKATEVLNVTITTVGNNCGTIAFTRLTGDMSTVDGTGALNSQTNCTIRISHTSTGNFREINIDLASNNIKSN